MTIRAFTPTDLKELERLYSLYFSKEFALPDFMDFICAFVVEDEKGVVTFGGVRDIAECIAVTNMGRHTRDRAKALYQLLDASVFVSKANNYDLMHVWSQNEKYTKRLIRSGFRYAEGQSLVLDL